MKRSRKHLGESEAHHHERMNSWFKSAVNNFNRITQNDHYLERPCSAIAHFTDVIAEATVAEVEAGYARNQKQQKSASDFVSYATKFQDDAIKACQITSRQGPDRELGRARKRKRK